MDTARYIRITNLCMLFFRAEGIAFSLYDKRDTCHLQYPEEPQRNTAALFAGRDPARTLDICTTPSHAGYASIRIKGGWRIVIGLSITQGSMKALWMPLWQKIKSRCAAPRSRYNSGGRTKSESAGIFRQGRVSLLLHGR